MAKIRVLLADDHSVLRSGLKMLINAESDMEVVGEASNTSEALEAAVRLRPDVVTLDLSMPGGGGLKFIEQSKLAEMALRIVVLTMHDDPAYFRGAVSAGATGYVVKTAADSELLTAIRAVHGGRMFVSIPSVRPEDLWTTPSNSEPSSPLSEREQQVLLFLAEGFTNKEIGERLELSVKTIETYRARLTSKLQLRTRADIVRYALDMGLLRQESVPSPPELAKASICEDDSTK